MSEGGRPEAVERKAAMYLPRQFEETDRAVLHALIAAHPLGTWVTQAGGGLLVNHIPFLVDASRGQHGTLTGHVARANPVWRVFSKSAPSVVVFQGPQSYITPSWYPGKHQHGKAVPTWNYAVVHAHGLPRVIEDKDWLLDHVTRQSDTREAGQAVPWKVTDAPAAYIDDLLKAIVGIEIPIAELVGKWKVSQNRTPADRQGVAEGLEARGDDAALAMAGLVRGYGEGE